MSSLAAVTATSAPQFAPTRSRSLWQLVRRIAFVLALSVVGFAVPLTLASRAAVTGSISGYVVFIPLLAALIASGYTQPPRGVADGESDWIAGILVAATGALVLGLTERRLPTYTGLWHIDNVEMIVWAAAAGMVTLSVRHVVRAWTVWVFLLITAPVLPFLLVTAQLGGSDTAVVALAAALGSVAVFLASRIVNWWRRLIATAVHVACAGLVTACLDLDSLFVRVALVTGLLPLLSVIAIHRATHVRRVHRLPHLTVGFPHRSRRSYVVLAIAAVGLLLHSLPIPPASPVPSAHSDWIARMGLRATAEFGFATEFIGPAATFTRYVPQFPPADGPQAAVDVITSPSLSRLRDLDDAIWYPSAGPVNYRQAQLEGPSDVEVRTAHTNADTAHDDSAGDWHLVTWLWHTDNGFQRVNIVVNQSVTPVAPPEPRPLTWGNSIVHPLLRLIGQPESRGDVAPEIADMADSLARQIIAAGTIR